MTRATTEAVALMPCPCCGSQPRSSRRTGVTGLAVKTKWLRETVACKCGLSIIGKRPNEAKERWNRRALSAPTMRTEPFAFFQWNEGWNGWEQVVEQARGQQGVIAAYRQPLYALAQPISDGRDTAARLICEDVLRQMVNASEGTGRKHFRELAAETLDRIAALATTPVIRGSR